MPDTMEPQAVATSESIVTKQEESNNNDENNEVKQSVYDVLGGNDQELAKRQYNDDEADEFDSDDRNGDIGMRKRPANNSVTRNSRDATMEEDYDDEANGSSNGRPRNGDENFLDSGDSTNGYQSDYSGYPGNGNNSGDDRQRQHQPNSSSVEPEQLRKLFIGGLDYKTSEATLKQHFDKFGDVIDCVVMREPQSKRSRGFGFVIYANSSMVDRAQEARPHEVDGREVQSKRAISREDSGKPEAQATVKKVYLGGLSDDIEESELRDYFKDFGNIVNVNIVAHKDTGKRRGFAFVEYDDYDPVDKIVLKKFHTIKDKRIEAKKAIPKVDMDARKRGDPRAAIAGGMIALSGPLDGPGGGRPPRSSRSNGGGGAGGGACLWEGGPYSASNYPAGSYSSQAGLDGYPPHYHSPSAHYGASSWMMHDAGGLYGLRAHGSGVYGGRTSYANQPSNWTTTGDYGSFPASQGSGSGGPMRLSYQHRSWGPYGSGYGGAHRGRGYNP